MLGTSWGFWKLGLQHVDKGLAVEYRPNCSGRPPGCLKNTPSPLITCRLQFELATPTGAAIISAFVEEYGSFSFDSFHQAGYGAGQRDIPGRPNVLAIYQGAPSPPPSPALGGRGIKGEGWGQDRVILLETLIDDMDPRLYPHVTELLFKKGALDVWWSPVGMKKGRPGISFSVLCSPEKENLIVEVLFQETTTLGVRRLPVQRHGRPA